MTQLNQTAPLKPLSANKPQDYAAQVRKTVRLLATPLTLFTSVAMLAFFAGTAPLATGNSSSCRLHSSW